MYLPTHAMVSFHPTNINTKQSDTYKPYTQIILKNPILQVNIHILKTQDSCKDIPTIFINTMMQ